MTGDDCDMGGIADERFASPGNIYSTGDVGIIGRASLDVQQK